MDDEDDDPQEELTSRDPSDEDLWELCRELNRLGAEYIVVGGFAIRHVGYLRGTMGIDLLIEGSLANEAKVFKALETLPDKAVLELRPGDVKEHTVVRVGDEIAVDLMERTCGLTYEAAKGEVNYHVERGVMIPFASPALLWRTKAPTRGEKDAGDLYFLRQWFAEAQIEPRNCKVRDSEDRGAIPS